MGYSKFKNIGQLSQKFGLGNRLVRLFPKIDPYPPSSWLLEAMEMGYSMPLTNEKSKAERLISPILMEVVKKYEDKLCLFSGEELNVDEENDLAGPCDFFFALHPPKLVLEAPIISLAEAKNENMDWGIAQCAAQMYGAYLFNHQNSKPVEVLYGCSTTGTEWQFLKFENKEFTVDFKPQTDLALILGVWHQILDYYVSIPSSN